MMCGTAEDRVLEWRATVAVCQNGGKKQVLDVRARLLGRSLRANSLGRPEIYANLDEMLI
jgi:hypothetical protein